MSLPSDLKKETIDETIIKAFCFEEEKQTIPLHKVKSVRNKRDFVLSIVLLKFC